VSRTAVSKEQIVDYYDSARVDYRLFWNLGKSYAMHYGFWDDKVKSFPEALERENEVYAEMAGIRSTDLVLDAGCGVGGSSIFLARKLGCRAIGITLSRKQAEAATENAKKSGVADRTEFHAMDFENMTFPDAKFDVVWAISSICYADSKQRFIEEAYRVLKPGGRLLVADGFMAKDRYTDDEERILEKWRSGWAVCSLESAASFGTFLKNAGFHRVSYRDVTEHVMPSSRRMYRLACSFLVFGRVAEILRIRKRTQTGNIVASRYQYKILRDGLCEYGVFYAEKA